MTLWPWASCSLILPRVHRWGGLSHAQGQSRGRAGQSSGRPEQIWPAHRLSGQGGRGCLRPPPSGVPAPGWSQTRGIRLTSSAFTTLAFVTLDAAGDRSFSFARKPGADTQLRWEEVDRSLIQRCRLFHFGSLSLTDEPARSATRAAVAYARELGRTVTFDPNLRLPLWPSPAEARAQILWSLCQADVVKLSDEEVDFLWGCSPQEGARRLLEECGVSLAMVTLGPRGCYLQNRRGELCPDRPPGLPCGYHRRGRHLRRERPPPPAGLPRPPGGAGPGRPGGDRPLCRHRRQPLHSAPRRHPQHPGAGPGGGPDGRARPPLPMNPPLVPSPFRVIISHSVLKEVALCPSKRKRPAAQSSPMTP